MTVRPCQVRGCGGAYEVYNVRTQVGTGDRMFQFECTANFRHRGFEVESVGRFVKLTARRWDTPNLTKGPTT